MNLDAFYPTSLLITGFDILFFLGSADDDYVGVLVYVAATSSLYCMKGKMPRHE